MLSIFIPKMYSLSCCAQRQLKEWLCVTQVNLKFQMPGLIFLLIELYIEMPFKCKKINFAAQKVLAFWLMLYVFREVG